jgi:hypothetical protein
MFSFPIGLARSRSELYCIIQFDRCRCSDHAHDHSQPGNPSLDRLAWLVN